jgi:hypothetical protein
MNLTDVMDEVAAAVDEITGLRMFAYPPGSLVAPAGAVSYPDSIDYDQTYGRGVDRISALPVIVVVGKATERAARNSVSAYTAGGGDRSVKAHLEGRAWTSCDDVSVTTARFDVYTIAGVDYLAALFSLDIIGPGGHP